MSMERWYYRSILATEFSAAAMAIGIAMLTFLLTHSPDALEPGLVGQFVSWVGTWADMPILQTNPQTVAAVGALVASLFLATVFVDASEPADSIAARRSVLQWLTSAATFVTAIGMWLMVPINAKSLPQAIAFGSFAVLFGALSALYSPPAREMRKASVNSRATASQLRRRHAELLAQIPSKRRGTDVLLSCAYVAAPFASTAIFALGHDTTPVFGALLGFFVACLLLQALWTVLLLSFSQSGNEGPAWVGWTVFAVAGTGSIMFTDLVAGATYEVSDTAEILPATVNTVLAAIAALLPIAAAFGTRQTSWFTLWTARAVERRAQFFERTAREQALLGRAPGKIGGRSPRRRRRL
jgi:hypothetical protein